MEKHFTSFFSVLVSGYDIRYQKNGFPRHEIINVKCDIARVSMPLLFENWNRF